MTICPAISKARFNDPGHNVLGLSVSVIRYDSSVLFVLLSNYLAHLEAQERTKSICTNTLL